MKKISILIILFIFYFGGIVNGQEDARVVFLHHSTGGIICGKGHVADSVQAYNKRNGTDYFFEDKAYPNKPYGWANYAYDYWNLWLNDYGKQYKGQENYPNVASLEDICNEYDVIIFKHCYPGADILEDTGNPDITSDRKSLENYKLQFRALREKFQEFPDKDFIVWTLVPRHRLVPDAPENAKRAKEFVDWVKNEWLSENGKTYDNIHVFDYFSLAAELNVNAKAPKVPYCLKYKYEIDHDDDNSHPNELAALEIGPKFYEYIIDVLKGRGK